MARADLIAVAAIALGITFQIKSLSDMLSRKSLAAARYDRTVRLFLIGLVPVATSVVVAIFTDVVGYGGGVL